MWLLDTNILIHFNKLGITQFEKEDIFTTILSLIEYPLGSKFNNVKIIFPSTIHYEPAFKNALLLREKGTPIPTIDILIGTITVEKNLILVSDDLHFQFLQEVEPRLKMISSELFEKKMR